MKTRVNQLAAACAIACLTIGLGARADEPAPGDAQRGKQLFELAKKLYTAGEFEEAAVVFGESYDANPRPGALFNQARCLEEAGEKTEAAAAYRAFIKAEPDGDATEEAQIRVAAIDRQLELEARKINGPNGTEGPSEKPVGSLDSRPGATLRLAGGVAMIAGVAWFSAGAFSGLKARSISNELEGRPRGDWTQRELERFEEGDSANQRAIVLMSVGGAAVVGGVLVYYLGHRAGRKAAVITPSLNRGGAGATVSISF